MTQQEKNSQRATGRAARQRLTPAQRLQYSTAACLLIAETKEFKSAKNIMSYLAVGSEMDMRTLHKLITSKNKKLYLPVCLSDGNMEARLYTGADMLVQGLFDTIEPRADTCPKIFPDELELVICPCLAFDAKLNRLGQGAGFYDRFLPGAGMAHIMAAAFDCQRLPDISHIPGLDIPMHAIATESGLYR